MKKIFYPISILLIICLLFTVLPAAAGASLVTNSEDFTFLHLTDLHIGSGVGSRVSPLVVSEALLAYPEAAFLVGGGDQTELGLPEEYQAYLNLLAPFMIPQYNTPGNHESRWTDGGKGYFKKYLGPTYQSWNYRGIHFVTLDSSIAKGQNGHFDPQMLSWLAQDLAALPKNTPIVFFSHHPFFFDEGDQEANFTDNDWDLWTTIRDYNVRAFFVGHGHRQGFWQVNGIPVIMTKAAMEYGYTAVTVNAANQEMIVNLKVLGTNGAPPSIQELIRIPLQDPRSTPKIRIISPQANSVVQGSFTLRAQLENWPTAPMRVESKLEDNKWYPMEFNGSTWERDIDLSNIDDGIRYFWVRAVDQQGHNYVDKIPVQVKQNSTVQLIWEVKTAGGIQGTPALGANYLYIGDNSGTVAAYSQKTGQMIWSYQTGGAVIGSPTINGNNLYVGSTDGKVYAFQLSSGKKLWEYQTSGAVVAQPLVTEGLVLIGSSDYNFYALDEKTGQLKWTFATGNTIMSQAAYGENTVFFGSWDNNFYGVDILSGQEKWRQPLATQVYYAPAASNPLYHNGKVYICTPGNRICALSASQGTILWEAKAASGLANPLIFNKAFINSTLSGSLYALDPESGENVWQYDTRISNFGSSPIPHGGALLLSTLTGKVSSLNIDSKTENWSYKPGDNYILGNSAAKGNRIFVPTMEGKLYALQAEPGIQPKPFPLIASFSDTADHWARADLNKLAALGLMGGFEDGSFRPDLSLTNAQTASILSRFLNYQEPSPEFKTSFTDIDGHWAAMAIAAMEEKGLINSSAWLDDSGKFKPDAAITRETALEMLAIALGLQEPTVGFASKFSDLDQTKNPALIMALEEKGLISGFAENGQLLLKPDSILTRAQYGVFLVRSLAIQ